MIRGRIVGLAWLLNWGRGPPLPTLSKGPLGAKKIVVRIGMAVFLQPPPLKDEDHFESVAWPVLHFSKKKSSTKVFPLNDDAYAVSWTRANRCVLSMAAYLVQDTPVQETAQSQKSGR